MLILKRWLIYFKKRASKKKPPQDIYATVAQRADGDKISEGPGIPQKGPAHFIPFPK